MIKIIIHITFQTIFFIFALCFSKFNWTTIKRFEKLFFLSTVYLSDFKYGIVKEKYDIYKIQK